MYPSDFYTTTVPVDDNRYYSHDAGDLGDGYLPFQELFATGRRVRYARFVANVGVYDADIVGAGADSVPLNLVINETCPISELQWRGAAEQSGSVANCRSVRNRPFCLAVAAEAASAGDILEMEYGDLHLAARSVQEFTIRQKYVIGGFAMEVTLGCPV